MCTLSIVGVLLVPNSSQVMHVNSYIVLNQRMWHFFCFALNHTFKLPFWEAVIRLSECDTMIKQEIVMGERE